ncbi:adenylate cyclase [Rhodopirellula sp. P2]|uniref:adenylate cyclase n=1 Tax=Rhodopirellula sp. P2 TaxID=2127060 RepID=UPI002368232C|nr:adenylate cyclase [Rhodopirellula sp. P2]WDQ16016.1 adenylate cyclase [Rhodopirellula sp. P2]
MNKQPTRPVTLKSAQRRWIRTIATLAILGTLFGMAWKPRLITENFLRDATDLMVSENDLSPIGAPSAEAIAMEQAVPNTPRPRHRWYVGGFPLDAYQTRLSVNEGQDGLENWSTLGWGLWIDLWFCIGLLALAGNAAYHIRPGQSPWNVLWSPKRVENTRYRRVLLSIVSVGLVVSAWHFYSTQRTLRTLDKESRITLARSTNHPMVARLPLALRGPWTHAVHVQCLPGTDMQSIDWSDYPSIQFISLQGDIDPETLQSIQENPWVTGLRWSNIPSIESANLVLERLPSLRSLSLSFNNIETSTEHAPDAKIQVQSLTSLSSLSLRRIPGTAICTDELLVPSLTSLEIQTIGPSVGSWLFEESNNLKSLSIRHLRRTGEKNPRASQLTVRLMPALSELSLDAGIPIDLRLLELPRLRNVQGLGSMTSVMEWSEQEEDYIVWVSSLKMSGLSSLSSLDLAGENFDQWEVSECPRLHTVRIKHPRAGGYGRFRRSMRGWEAPPELVDARLFAAMASGTPLPKRKSPRGLMAFAASLPSLQSLNLNGMNLTTCEFSKLQACSFLKSLTLDRCGMDPRQLEELCDVSSLRELSVSGADIDPEVVPRLLAMHNHWEVLELPWEELHTIRIIDQPKLKRAFTTRTLRAKHIELVNLESLVSRLRVAPGAETIRVINLPSLTEISIRRPKTKDIVIEDVPHLLSFTLEQGVLNSSTLSSLTQSRQLHSLILPGSRYPRGLAKHFLCWPGLQEFNAIATPLRDDDLRDLPNLKNLRRLRLDDTALTAKGISTLARCDHLQSISLLGLDLSSTALEPLMALSWLMELSVNDAVPLPDSLQSIRLTPEDWATQKVQPHMAGNWPNGLRTNVDRGKNFVRRGPQHGQRLNWATNEETDSNEPLDSLPVTLTTDAT